MDRLLKPKSLDILPTDSEAPAVFKYWLATFETFVSTAVECQERLDPAVQVNKRGLLVNFLSPTVYPYIGDCETYDLAITALKAAYHQKKNDVFARHILATRKQQVGKSLQQFLHTLKVLSKDCSFEAVSAEKYREDLSLIHI